MALISRFEERSIYPTRIHDEGVCGFAAATIGTRRVLQLETYGSASRKIPGEVSQCIQLDDVAARELRRILDVCFPGNV